MGARGSVAVVLALLLACEIGCGSRQAGDGGETGDGETGDGDTGAPDPCEAATSPWFTTRTGYPALFRLWTDGEQVLADGDALLTHVGETLTLHEDIPELEGAWLLGARAIDEAWLAKEDKVYAWDGASLTSTISGLHDMRVAVTNDAVYLMAKVTCTPLSCAARVWQWDAGDWIELDGPELDDANELWAGPDGELWIAAEQGLFAHRVDGQWTIEELGDPTFSANALTVDASARVWAAGGSSQLDLAWRDLDGVWTGITVPSPAYGQVRLLPGDGEVVVFASGLHEFELLRWTGNTGPSLIANDSWFANLGITTVYDVAGTAAQLHMLSSGPAVHVLDLLALPLEPEPVFVLTSSPPVPGRAYGVDAAFEPIIDKLYRYDDDHWEPVLELPKLGSGDHYIGPVQPLSAEQAWLIVDPDISEPGKEIWRWEAGQASPWPSQPSSNLELQRLWGTGSEWVWMTGLGNELARVWRFDGIGWVEVLGSSDGHGEILGITGDAERVFVITRDGVVLQWFDDEWTQVGTTLQSELSFAQIARVGDELLVRYEWQEGWDFPTTFDATRRFDGETWQDPDAALPQFSKLVDDGQGHAWAWSSDAGLIYRHDGESQADLGWAPIELAIHPPVTLMPTPDGIVVHDERNTSVFRLACE